MNINIISLCTFLFALTSVKSIKPLEALSNLVAKVNHNEAVKPFLDIFGRKKKLSKASYPSYPEIKRNYRYPAHTYKNIPWNTPSTTQSTNIYTIRTTTTTTTATTTTPSTTTTTITITTPTATSITTTTTPPPTTTTTPPTTTTTTSPTTTTTPLPPTTPPPTTTITTPPPTTTTIPPTTTTTTPPSTNQPIQRSCNIQPVNCAWGPYEEWEKCSKTCGGGVKTRKRKIMTKMSGGGVDCLKEDRVQTGLCNEDPCEMDGGCRWTDWTLSAGCDKSETEENLYVATMTRSKRYSNNHKDDQCQGPGVYYINCRDFLQCATEAGINQFQDQEEDEKKTPIIFNNFQCVNTGPGTLVVKGSQCGGHGNSQGGETFGAKPSQHNHKHNHYHYQNCPASEAESSTNPNTLETHTHQVLTPEPISKANTLPRLYQSPPNKPSGGIISEGSGAVSVDEDTNSNGDTNFIGDIESNGKGVVIGNEGEVNQVHGDGDLTLIKGSQIGGNGNTLTISKGSGTVSVTPRSESSSKGDTNFGEIESNGDGAVIGNEGEVNQVFGDGDLTLIKSSQIGGSGNTLTKKI